MEKDKKCYIEKLPPEILPTILQHAEIEDIIAFGATCKYFNDMINDSQIIWKMKLKKIMPSELFFTLEKDSNGVIWFDRVKEFYTIRQKVYSEILAMSPKYFWQHSSLTLHDVRRFFTIALNNNMHYYYTIYLLQDLVSTGAKNTALWEGRPPYTMTEMHYAKVVLSHLMHAFLCVKWAQRYNTDHMLPQAVLTFFLQWTNVVKLYNQEEVDNEINNLVRDVEVLLVPEIPKTLVPGEVVKEQVMKKVLKQRDVISAISQVVYRYRQIVVTPAMDLNTLNIIEVLKKKTGHVIAVACIYQAIAAQCGITCNVIAFTNHFFIEWMCTEIEHKTQVHKINIETGEVLLNRRCPFSAQSADSSCAYCPNSLLRYIITSYTNTVGRGHLGANNWYKQNAFLLYEMLNPEAAQHSPYYNYYRYLTHDVPLSLLSPIGIKYIENEHMQILLSLTYLNAPANTCERSRSLLMRGFMQNLPLWQSLCNSYIIRSLKENAKSEQLYQMITVKKRNSQVKYAVGMICFHKRYLYTGIIVGWDPICDGTWSQRPEFTNLRFGSTQPFYTVIAADESSRYVPQENLVFVTNPQRLIQLEDFIAREFTHFNGFAYVPNTEKRVEYPEDFQISEMFLNRAENKIGVCLTDPYAVIA